MEDADTGVSDICDQTLQPEEEETHKVLLCQTTHSVAHNLTTVCDSLIPQYL